MRPVIHMCGVVIEYLRESGFFDPRTYEQIHQCPQCKEYLCLTDCLDLGGQPVFIPFQSDWSRRRRRERGWPE